MAIVDSLVPEFDHEMATTRRLLDLVPEGRFDWKPHVKSRTLGELAEHLATMPVWCSAALGATCLDLDALDAPPAPPPSRAQLLDAFDKRLSTARAQLVGTTDPEMFVPWTLKKGDQEVFTMPRISVLRTFVMNHMVHHRGQLSVYLRLNDVPLPSIYGPTADERF
jgi:uncharacterized damage-inducible protein DinB